jgi:hypothetical protein
MPRASWRGFLRFSSVLPDLFVAGGDAHETHSLAPGVQPAPADVDEDDLPDRSGGQQGSERSVTRLRADSAAPDGEQSPPPPASRSARMIREPARRSRSARSSKDTNSAGANS